MYLKLINCEIIILPEAEISLLIFVSPEDAILAIAVFTALINTKIIQILLISNTS